MQEMSNNNEAPLQIQTVPPGFRFHPTDEELVDYYLRRKMNSIRIELDVIKEIDLYKVEPWDLNELCGTGMEETDEWYFFSYKDKKYPTGTRTNRATAMGFWKATGRDKAIYSNGGGGGGGNAAATNNNNAKRELIGLRKTLVYYQGRAPNGQKSDWIMHEYRLESEIDSTTYSQEEGWVVCRVFRKRMAATARRLQAINELEPPSQFWPMQQNYNNHQLSSFILPATATDCTGSSTQQGSHHNQQQMMMMMNNASPSDYQFLLQTAGCSSDMIKSELLIHEQLPNLSNQYCHDQQSPFPSTLVQNPAGQQVQSASSADDSSNYDGWSVDHNNMHDQSHHGKNTQQQQQRRMSMMGGRREQRQKQRFQQQQFTAAASPMLMQEEDNNNNNMVDQDEQMTDWRVLDKLVASQLSPDVDEYEDAFETSDD